MNINIGSIDRVIRIILVALLAGLYFSNVIAGTAALILGGIAVILLATSFVGTCPLYLPFGISTRTRK